MGLACCCSLLAGLRLLAAPAGRSGRLLLAGLLLARLLLAGLVVRPIAVRPASARRLRCSPDGLVLPLASPRRLARRRSARRIATRLVGLAVVGSLRLRRRASSSSIFCSSCSRLLADALLIVGQLRRVVAAVGAGLHAALQADQPVEVLQIAEHALALGVELPVAVFLQQQVEQLFEVGLQARLAVDRRTSNFRRASAATISSNCPDTSRSRPCATSCRSSSARRGCVEPESSANRAGEQFQPVVALGEPRFDRVEAFAGRGGSGCLAPCERASPPTTASAQHGDQPRKPPSTRLARDASTSAVTCAIRRWLAATPPTTRGASRAAAAASRSRSSSWSADDAAQQFH